MIEESARGDLIQRTYTRHAPLGSGRSDSIVLPTSSRLRTAAACPGTSCPQWTVDVRAVG